MSVILIPPFQEILSFNLGNRFVLFGDFLATLSFSEGRMKLFGFLLYLLCCSVSTGSRRSKRDSIGINKGHLKKATDTLVQTNAALTAVKIYKDQSRALTDLIQVITISAIFFVG